MDKKKFPSENELRDMLDRGEISRDEFVEMMDQRIRQQAFEEMTRMQRQKFAAATAHEKEQSVSARPASRRVRIGILLVMLLGLALVIGMAILLLALIGNA